MRLRPRDRVAGGRVVALVLAVVMVAGGGHAAFADRRARGTVETTDPAIAPVLRRLESSGDLASARAALAALARRTDVAAALGDDPASVHDLARIRAGAPGDLLALLAEPRPPRSTHVDPDAARAVGAFLGRPAVRHTLNAARLLLRDHSIRWALDSRDRLNTRGWLDRFRQWVSDRLGVAGLIVVDVLEIAAGAFVVAGSVQHGDIPGAVGGVGTVADGVNHLVNDLIGPPPPCPDGSDGVPGERSPAAYTASGTIQCSAPQGVSATDLEFRHQTCPGTPSTQGLDAYVFALPSGYAGMGTTVTLTAPSSTPHDLGAYIYNSDCSFDRKVSTPTTFDLTLRLATDDTYVVVYTTMGADVVVSLTATPATTTTYYDEGSIMRSAPTGVSVTDTEFSLTCANAPASQGTDAWVFRLPPSLAGASVTITAVPSTAVHDFVVILYNSDCSFDRTIDDVGSFDATFAPDLDNGYASVVSTTGANILVELTA